MGLRARGAALSCSFLAGAWPIVSTHLRTSSSLPLLDLASGSFSPALTFLTSAVLCNLGLASLYFTSSKEASKLRYLAFASVITLSLPLLAAFYAFETSLPPRLAAYAAWCCFFLVFEAQMIQRHAYSCDSMSPSPRLREPLLHKTQTAETLAKTSPISPARPSLGVSISSKLLGSFSRSFSFALTPAHGPDTRQWSEDEPDTCEGTGSLDAEAAAMMFSCLSEDSEEQKAAAKMLRGRSRDLGLVKVLLMKGFLPHLLDLCKSNDSSTSKHAQTALFNISLDESIKPLLSDAVPFLVQGMGSHSPERAQLAGATAYSLSVSREMAQRMHECGAIESLVSLMKGGTDSARRDASKALFNITRHWDVPSTHEEVISSLLQADAVPAILKALEEPSSPVAQKSVLILRNIVKSDIGCKAIAEHHEGIPVLASLLDSRVPQMQEMAASLLLGLAEREPSYRQMVWEEAPMMSLEMIQNRGTPRGRQKAAALLELLSPKKTSRQTQLGTT